MYHAQAHTVPHTHRVRWQGRLETHVLHMHVSLLGVNVLMFTSPEIRSVRRQWKF